MKKTRGLSLSLVIFFIAVLVIVQGAKGAVETKPFQRVVAMLKNADTKTIVHNASNGIRITCTIFPRKRFIAFAWEIENPHNAVLRFGPGSISVSDEVERLEEIDPAKVADLLFGLVLDKEFIDPFVDSQYAERYEMPNIKPRTRKEEDIYRTSFNFENTDSKWVAGFTYYSRQASSNNLTATMALGGETVKFEF